MNTMKFQVLCFKLNPFKFSFVVCFKRHSPLLISFTIYITLYLFKYFPKPRISNPCEFSASWVKRWLLILSKGTSYICSRNIAMDSKVYLFTTLKAYLTQSPSKNLPYTIILWLGSVEKKRWPFIFKKGVHRKETLLLGKYPRFSFDILKYHLPSMKLLKIWN